VREGRTKFNSKLITSFPSPCLLNQLHLTYHYLSQWVYGACQGNTKQCPEIRLSENKIHSNGQIFKSQILTDMCVFIYTYIYTVIVK
jgi:hypothetical protein